MSVLLMGSMSIYLIKRYDRMNLGRDDSYSQLYVINDYSNQFGEVNMSDFDFMPTIKIEYDNQ